MSNKLAEILSLIQQERERQFDLPGSEWDYKNTPNDWVAKAAKYLVRNVGTGVNKPSVKEFTEDFVKSAAVIVATLEHIEEMRNRKELD